MIAESSEGGITPILLRDARLLLIGKIVTPVKTLWMDLPTVQAQDAYAAGVSALRSDTNISYICQAPHQGYISSGGTERDEESLTLAAAVKLMNYLASTKMTQLPSSPVTMLTYSFVAMAKRGTVSEEFFSKFVEGIRQDEGVTIAMIAQSIKQLWSYYGDVMSDLVAENLFAMWINELSPNIAFKNYFRVNAEHRINDPNGHSKRVFGPTYVSVRPAR
ncbi:unnamed protein product [Nippostrongylus brasiliensis]|uniref:Peptidase_M1 domain-containing protein n=1 Tax=Nippostrongylus brasiliensis TaxID=27835 RepID=A0A0N4XXW0_NIPBR|nr:unnamed protein product [Nippostrongylus brasiliensis]